MKTCDFLKKYKHIHFVGIGGIGMSALAKLCFSKGVEVSGSDRAKSKILDELLHIGITIYTRHKKSNVLGADLVVYTCAVGKKNSEVMQAKKLGIKVLERAEFLGIITQEFKEVIAIAGSHGKTTVCSMLASIFLSAGKNPTVLVGGQTNKFGNLLIGGQKYMILEACEYMSHFLSLKRTTAVVLNIDFDHPDFFKSQKQYADAFFKFASTAKNVVANENLKMFFEKKPVTFGTFGNFSCQNIKFSFEKTSFDVLKNGHFFAHITLDSVGANNVQNALCAIAVADLYGIQPRQIVAGLKSFDGIKRRYEFMGKLGTNFVIADYAHHPTQIKDCINATRLMCGTKKIVVVFEPHTYSRTKCLFSGFVSALSLADHIVILPTYSAREKPIDGGSAKDIYRALKFVKNDVHYKASHASCQKFLTRYSDCIILLLGAGSIVNLAENIKQEYVLLHGK